MCVGCICVCVCVCVTVYVCDSKKPLAYWAMRLDKLNSKTNWRLSWRWPSPFTRRPAPHALSQVFWGDCSLTVSTHITYSYSHPYSYWYSYVACELYAMSSYSRFIFLFFSFFSCACELCVVCVCVFMWVDNAGMMLERERGGACQQFIGICVLACQQERFFFYIMW